MLAATGYTPTLLASAASLKPAEPWWRVIPPKIVDAHAQHHGDNPQADVRDLVLEHPVHVDGCGFRVQGLWLGFRIEGLGFRV